MHRATSGVGISTAAALCLLAAAGGCGRSEPRRTNDREKMGTSGDSAAGPAKMGMMTSMEGMPAPAAYANEADSLPRLKFVDGSTSLNDRCPVRKAKLNRRLPPLLVNGQPIGFC